MAPHRHIWMDAIRGGAILLVLVDHAAVFLTIQGLTVPTELAFFTAAASPYRMPLLMYLSGLLLQRSLAKPWRPFALGKLRNIGWPYVVWSVVTLAATTGITARAVVLIPFIPPTFLWFLWFILAFYGIGWVCHRLNFDPLVAATIALITSVFLPDFARASRFAFLLFFFLLGHAVVTRSVRSGMPGPARRLVLALCAASVIITSGLALMGHDISYEAAYVVGPLGLMILVQTLSGYYRSSCALRALEYIGKNSLVFYVMHYSIAWVLVAAAVSFGISSGRVVFVLTFGISLAVGVALCHFRDRWQPVGWLFAFPARAERQRNRVTNR